MKISHAVAAIAAALAVNAFSGTYYWKPTYESAEFDATRGYGSWSDSANWSTESEAGASASGVPDEGDEIYGLGDEKWRQFDLGGKEWSIGGWNTTGDWARHNWRFKNGTIHWTGEYSTHSDTVHLDEGSSFIFDKGAKYNPSVGHAASDEWRVHSGASLSLLCELSIYNINIEIDEGASVLFNPWKMYFDWTAQHSYLQNEGKLELPNGILFSTGTFQNHKFELRQLGGELIVGGPLTKNGQIGQYSMTIGGGTVKATGDVYVDFETVQVTGSFELETNEGSLFDLSNFTFAPGVTLTKRGAGDVVLSAKNMPDNLAVLEGGLVLALSDVPHDLSGVVFGDGAKVKVSDGFLPVSGATVVTCSNEEVLNKAMGDLNAALSDTGIKLVVSGDSLVAESSAFVFTGKGRWNEIANWEGRTIPSASAVAYVRGEGSELLLDDSTIVMPAGIVVEDGAALKVTASVALPLLTLAPAARLEIGDNETQPKTVVRFDSDPVTSFRISGDTVTVPAFNVATNATIAFSYPAKLKNFDMTLCGTATTSGFSVGDIRFGYAAKGETAYFGLCADGATFHPLVDSWRLGSDFGANFIRPEAGGRVRQLRPFRFVRCSFPCEGSGDFSDVYIGGDNPEDEPCELIFDATAFIYTYHCRISSSATLRFINGSTISYGRRATISAEKNVFLEKAARIELDGSQSCLLPRLSEFWYDFNPDVQGHESVVLKNGGSVVGSRFRGNGKAVLAVYDGEWIIPRINGAEVSVPVLSGFAAASVKEGGEFRIVARNTIGDVDWDRNLVVASPITGAGDVLVLNAVESNSMEITVTNAANTCTGAIACNGANSCRLLFADGAVWAGTVVAGNVALVNLDDAGASKVSFGALRLDGTFPLRVWKGEDGKITRNDTLNVGEYVNNGGRLVPELAGEGEFVSGDKIVVGEIGDSSPLPRVAKGWTASRKTIDGKGMLMLSKGVGFMMIVR